MTSTDYNMQEIFVIREQQLREALGVISNDIYSYESESISHCKESLILLISLIGTHKELIEAYNKVARSAISQFEIPCDAGDLICELIGKDSFEVNGALQLIFDCQAILDLYDEKKNDIVFDTLTQDFKESRDIYHDACQIMHDPLSLRDDNELYKNSLLNIRLFCIAKINVATSNNIDTMNAISDVTGFDREIVDLIDNLMEDSLHVDDFHFLMEDCETELRDIYY